MKSQHIRSVVVYLLLICFIVGASFADNKTDTDELIKNINNAEGSQKITLMLELSEKISSLDPPSAFDWAKKAVDMAADMSEDYLEVDAYNQMGYSKLLAEEEEEASKYFQIAYEKALGLNYLKGAGFSQNGYGLLWTHVDDYAKALSDFEKAQEYFVEADYKLGEAFTINNRGAVYESIDNFALALDDYIYALKIYEENDKKDDMAVTYNNIGSLNSRMGNLEDALEYYSKSLDISDELGNELDMASTLNNMAILYEDLGYNKEAISLLSNAYELSTKNEDAPLTATTLLNTADVHEKMEMYDEALTNYGIALETYDEIGDMQGVVTVLNNVGTLYSKTGDYETALSKHNDALKLSSEITYQQGLESALHNLSIDYQNLGDYQKANKYLTLYSQMKEHIRGEAVAKKFADAQVLYQTEKKDEEIANQKEELNAQQLRMRLILIILSGVAVFLIIVIILSINIYKERQKSEKLLLNILPKKVADTLKKYGKSEPETFPEVTMYFSDIAGFTNTSKDLDPAYLIEELNDMFTIFDGIMEGYGCERIKTIGDAYMAVCGLPAFCEDHAERMARASMDIIKALHERNQSAEITWRIRVGLHTGSVTGGIVGVKKYIYDVFGDTVNTASRMESNSEPMRINVSDVTYEILKDKFEFTKREPMEVKGKGVFQMYFLDGEKE